MLYFLYSTWRHAGRLTGRHGNCWKFCRCISHQCAAVRCVDGLRCHISNGLDCRLVGGLVTTHSWTHLMIEILYKLFGNFFVFRALCHVEWDDVGLHHLFGCIYCTYPMLGLRTTFIGDKLSSTTFDCSWVNCEEQLITRHKWKCLFVATIVAVNYLPIVASWSRRHQLFCLPLCRGK